MDLEKYTLVELRQMAKEKGAKNISKMKKDELLEFLNNANQSENNDTNNTQKITSESQESHDSQDNEDNNASGYKLTNEGDKIVEGVLEVLPDGYGFLCLWRTR